MLRWSFRLFKIRGIQLSVHGSFLLLLAYVAYEGWGLDGWTGLGWSVALLVTFFTCVVLHELGHSLVALSQGVKVRSITLFLLGGVASVERECSTAMGSLMVAAAGPLVSLVLAFGLLFARHGAAQIGRAHV